MAQMNRAAIFAHPALYEPFGLCVLEAARARCCLVLSDIPSLRELWDGAAVFIDPRNPDAWISEINRLSRDLDLIESLALRAQSHSLKYSATSIDEYFDIYCRLRAGCLESRKRGAA
jgi:glycosyltransferase involved in cell wall biosynthesis